MEQARFAITVAKLPPALRSVVPPPGPKSCDRLRGLIRTSPIPQLGVPRHLLPAALNLSFEPQAATISLPEQGNSSCLIPSAVGATSTSSQVTTQPLYDMVSDDSPKTTLSTSSATDECRLTCSASPAIHAARTTTSQAKSNATGFRRNGIKQFTDSHAVIAKCRFQRGSEDEAVRVTCLE
ncbi:hypothetical protein HPB51_026931 [Rhipicephalus microplus]|uniref:Uncharacterized protein n=1 Tax=Rhipicephalus microplus TaxID=6941 RepID=A0A9J6D1B9_RHIMP|nr:hypothetical protein HPB51_026931 [Rhipicephalus microplus]